MKTLLNYLKPVAARIGLGVFVKAVGTMMELLLPAILSHVLKVVVARRSLREILLWGVLMILCATVAVIMNVKANQMAARVSRDFSRSVRRDLFHRTLRLSAAQTDYFTVPSLESRITTDTYNVHNFVGMMQRMGIRAPILLLGGIIITLIMDRHLALVMIAVMPFLFVLVTFVRRKGTPLYSNVQKSVDDMVRVVREDAQGIRVIKALSKTEYEHRRYDGVNRKLASDERKAGINMGMVHPIMTVLMNGGIVAVVALAAGRVAGGKSDPETVIAFMQYFTQISMAMMALSRMFVMYTKCSASARRISEVLNAPEDLVVQKEEDYPAKATEMHIEFEDVCFSYLGRRDDIEHISFSVPRGGSLGIIGATGSGKSTLVKLLLRFYDVGSGTVRINGRDVRTIPHDEFYAMFGTAMQYDFLYADTIEENIRFGRDLTHEQIVEAAVTAQAHDFITGFADGYGHMLSAKGTNISGGQKQRLLIARAVAAKSDILVLDDSSSALDYKTDAALRHALKERVTDSTVITVAQRVSSIKDCDLILVLEDGAIIGAGDHEHLLATCAEYKEISESQMGGAFVE